MICRIKNIKFQLGSWKKEDNGGTKKIEVFRSYYLLCIDHQYHYFLAIYPASEIQKKRKN